MLAQPLTVQKIFSVVLCFLGLWSAVLYVSYGCSVVVLEILGSVVVSPSLSRLIYFRAPCPFRVVPTYIFKLLSRPISSVTSPFTVL